MDDRRASDSEFERDDDTKLRTSLSKSDIEMTRTIEEIETDLSRLTAEDFNLNRLEADGMERLYELTDEILTLTEPQTGIHAMFAIMERMPIVDLGSPGPLVHTLEKMRGMYELELVESVKRSPALLTLWMVNRILNVTKVPEERARYLALLHGVADDASKHAVLREEAKQFIEHQSKSN